MNGLRTGITIAACGAAGLLALWLLSGTAEEPVPPAGRGSAETGAGEPAVPVGATPAAHRAALGSAPAQDAESASGGRVLDAAARLAGRVTRAADGAAVAGARVAVRTSSGVRRAGVTDGDGEFWLGDLPGGDAELRVVAERLATPRAIEIALELGRETRRDVALDDGVDVRGRVVDDLTGDPIAGAEVGEGISFEKCVVADDAGEFCLRGYSVQHNLDLIARAEGHVETRVRIQQRAGDPDIATEVTIRLPRGREAIGVVLDHDGRPLGGCSVAAVASDHGGDDGAQRLDRPDATTDEDGRFTVSALHPDMEHVLVLSAPGLGRRVYDFPPDERTRPTVDFGALYLEPAARLRGRVVDEIGAGVAGVEVTLHGHNADRARYAGPAPADRGYRSVDYYAVRRAVRSDPAGAFAFDGLAAGRYTISASLDDKHDRRSIDAEVAAGEERAGLVLELWRGLAIAGTVEVADGGTLPKCYVSVDAEPGAKGNRDVEVRDGRFRAEGLGQGTFTVSVYPYPSDADRRAGRRFASAVRKGVPAGTDDLVVRLERAR